MQYIWGGKISVWISIGDRVNAQSFTSLQPVSRERDTPWSCLSLTVSCQQLQSSSSVWMAAAPMCSSAVTLAVTMWGQSALSIKVWLLLSFYLLWCMRMNGLFVTSINISSEKRLHPSRTLERGSVPWQSIPADHSTFFCGTSFKALLKVLVWMSYTLNREDVLSKTLRYFPSSQVKEL